MELEQEQHLTFKVDQSYQNDLDFEEVVNFLANSPNENIWKTVKKTDDLESFRYYLSWKNKKTAQAIIALKNKENTENLFYMERKIRYLMDKKNYELILLDAERIIKIWDLVNIVSPIVFNHSHHCHNLSSQFPSLKKIFIEKINKLNIYEFRTRSSSYFEIFKDKQKQKWEKLRFPSSPKHLNEEDEICCSSYFWEEPINYLIAQAYSASKENQRVKYLLTQLSETCQNLAHEAYDEYTCGRRAKEHRSEVWRNGERYILNNNKSERAPYNHGLVRLVWSDLLVPILSIPELPPDIFYAIVSIFETSNIPGVLDFIESLRKTD